MIITITISPQKPSTDIHLAFRKTHTKLRLEACFLKNKKGDFFRVHNERRDNHDLLTNQARQISFELLISLDSEEKYHLAKIYGVIDAIGTLGGVHEIVLWCIILIYGSIRKNLCLFSIINRLIQTEQLQDTTREKNNEHRDGNQMTRIMPDQLANHNINRHNNAQNHNYTPIHRSEDNMRPRIF